MANPEKTNNILQAAQLHDAADPLREFRSEFSFPKNQDGSDKLYFCGNSLGLQHDSVPVVLEEVMGAWRDLAVDGHFTGNRPWLK